MANNMASKGTKSSQQKTSTSTSTKGPPTKQAKRTNSELSNESSLSDQSFNMTHLQNQLDIMTENLRELQESIKLVLKKEDIEKLITTTLKSVIDAMEKRMKVAFDDMLKEKTRDFNDKIDSLEMENSILKTKVENLESKYDKKLTSIGEQMAAIERQSKEANIRSNYNEQYSRKNNVKVMDIQEEDKQSIETLTDKVCQVFDSKNISLMKEDIVAIHRIPSKRGGRRPVLIKTKNNAVKTKLMRGRRTMKEAGHRLVDEVTRLNTGLINRLLQHPEVQSAWFFNGSVFGQTVHNERVKFEIYDNIDTIISQYRQSSKPRGGRQ